MKLSNNTATLSALLQLWRSYTNSCPKYVADSIASHTRAFSIHLCPICNAISLPSSSVTSGDRVLHIISVVTTFGPRSFFRPARTIGVPAYEVAASSAYCKLLIRSGISFALYRNSLSCVRYTPVDRGYRLRSTVPLYLYLRSTVAGVSYIAPVCLCTILKAEQLYHKYYNMVHSLRRIMGL